MKKVEMETRTSVSSPVVSCLGTLVWCTLFACTSVACWQTPPSKPPESQAVTVQVPTFHPAQEGQETQERSGVVVQMAPPLFEVNDGSERTCLRRNTVLVSNSIYSYDVKETPNFSVSPQQVVFAVKITNRTTQVLKLAGTVFKLNVGGAEVVVEREVTQSFIDSVLTPNQSQEFDISGPRWDSLSPDSTVSFSIFGMPTELDQAGNVSRRENFDWTFAYVVEDQERRGQVKTSVVSMTQDEASGSCDNL